MKLVKVQKGGKGGGDYRKRKKGTVMSRKTRFFEPARNAIIWACHHGADEVSERGKRIHYGGTREAGRDLP